MSARPCTAQRLNLARHVLARAQHAGHTGSRPHTRPTSVPEADTLPTHEPLRQILPGGGLARGSVVSIPAGEPSVLMALIAEASARGSWCALVGMPDVGVVAAAEAGIELARLALIPHPGTELVAVIAALLEGIDLVAVADTAGLRPGDRQRLAARARASGSVLLPLSLWPGATLRVELTTSTRNRLQPAGWRGLAGDGHGRLRERQVQLRTYGRGADRASTVLLPGPQGRLAPIPASARTWPAHTAVARESSAS